MHDAPKKSQSADEIGLRYGEIEWGVVKFTTMAWFTDELLDDISQYVAFYLVIFRSGLKTVVT